jgi:hypothetical protein
MRVYFVGTVFNDIEWFLDRIREDLSAIAFYGDGSTPQESTMQRNDGADGKAQVPQESWSNLQMYYEADFHIFEYLI